MPDSSEFRGSFLIADLTGYTALAEAHGDFSAAQIINRYNDIVKGLLTVGRQNLSEFLYKILRDTFVKYKHYLHFPFPGSDDLQDRSIRFLILGLYHCAERLRRWNSVAVKLTEL